MSTSTRITRSKGESDGLSLPMRMRPTRKDTTSGRNGGTALNTTCNAGQDQQQQMPTQTPHLPTQSPQAASAERTKATAPMLPPGPHRPLMPRMPLPASPTSSSWSSTSLFKEDKYSSTSEEESEADAEVTFIHGRSHSSGTFVNSRTERPTSTPTTSDYTTQGDPDASPSTSNLFRSTVTNDEFLGTNNFFMPDGSNRCIYQIDNKVFHAGYLENGNNAYLLELPALDKMLNTWKFLMDESVRTILRCVWQQLPADVHEANATTSMGYWRTHRRIGRNKASFWIHQTCRINTTTGHRNAAHCQYITPTR